MKALIFHRRWREGEIAGCLRAGVSSVAGMVQQMYSRIEPSLSHAAALSVLAQIEFMVEKGSAVMLKPGPDLRSGVCARGLSRQTPRPGLTQPPGFWHP